MTTEIVPDTRIFHPALERLYGKIAGFFKDPFGQKRLKAEYEVQERQKSVNAFIEQVLIPDMLARGFGFGRAAVAEYLRRQGVSSFVELDNLTFEIIDGAAEAKGVGPKVFQGFLKYIAARAEARRRVDDEKRLDGGGTDEQPLAE